MFWCGCFYCVCKPGIFNTFMGIVYLIPLLVGSCIIYLFFFDLLHEIVFPGVNPNSIRSSSKRKEYVFVVALVIAALCIAFLDVHYSSSNEEISSKIIEKTRLTRGRVSIRRVDCLEIELESDARQCVDSACWHSVELGDKILIQPRFGLFGLPKLNVQCERQTG